MRVSGLISQKTGTAPSEHGVHSETKAKEGTIICLLAKIQQKGCHFERRCAGGGQQNPRGAKFVFRRA
jgi:hypothetical protein